MELKDNDSVEIKETLVQAPSLSRTTGAEPTPGQPDRDPTGSGEEGGGDRQNESTRKQQNRYTSRVILKTCRPVIG